MERQSCFCVIFKDSPLPEGLRLPVSGGLQADQMLTLGLLEIVPRNCSGGEAGGVPDFSPVQGGPRCVQGGPVEVPAGPEFTFIPFPYPACSLWLSHACPA